MTAIDSLLNDKRALVIGGGRGIGRAISLQLAEAGARLALVEALLMRYRNDRGPAIVWVSHDPEQLRRNCDRICALQNGELSIMDPISTSEGDSQ